MVVIQTALSYCGVLTVSLHISAGLVNSSANNLPFLLLPQCVPARRQVLVIPIPAAPQQTSVGVLPYSRYAINPTSTKITLTTGNLRSVDQSIQIL